MSSDGICYRILGIEDQQKVHYAMPLRCMIYDALNYLRQVDEYNRKRHLTTMVKCLFCHSWIMLISKTDN